MFGVLFRNVSSGRSKACALLYGPPLHLLCKLFLLSPFSCCLIVGCALRDLLLYDILILEYPAVSILNCIAYTTSELPMSVADTV